MQSVELVEGDKISEDLQPLEFFSQSNH